MTTNFTNWGLGLTALLVSVATGCNSSSTSARDAAVTTDALTGDTGDTGDTSREADVDRVSDAAVPSHLDAVAAGNADATTDPGLATVHSCGAFSQPSGWTTAPGFRSAVVVSGAPLMQPVALTFAGRGFGDGAAFVLDQAARALFRLDARTGTVSTTIAADKWGATPVLPTTVIWDADAAFDGGLYVGDQGGDGDQDSVIFAVATTGTSRVFAKAPGAGMDDIYGLGFSPGGDYPPGLLVSGDTDGASDGFGRINATAKIVTFAKFSGVEGMAVDRLGRFGGGLFASMPNGGGYSGDDTVSKINPDGTKTSPLAKELAGVHALVFAPVGPFGADAYVASWATNTILRIAADGKVTDLAKGLALTNYDGNILAFSPDGRVLFVADRNASRIVCIERAP